MNYLELLAIGANVAAIVTACFAGWAYCSYRWERRGKRIRLENYLKHEKEEGADKGQRTIMHLVARLGMTETEIVDAAFRSNCIERKIKSDGVGTASKLLLEYVCND